MVKHHRVSSYLLQRVKNIHKDAYKKTIIQHTVLTIFNYTCAVHYTELPNNVLDSLSLKYFSIVLGYNIVLNAMLE